MRGNFANLFVEDLRVCVCVCVSVCECECECVSV